MRSVSAILFGGFLAATGHADTPKVVTDIAPVHSLVAQVMDGVGMPGLILPPGASPHHNTLRPSQARSLAETDLVVWIGPDLTPWLGKPLSTLAAGADQIVLSELPDTQLLSFRSPEDDDHDHDHEHDEEAHDPHLWLDPENARAWLPQVADRLAQLDPDNAERYRQNAARAAADLAVLSDEISEAVAPMQDKPFVAFHDAYHYFEDRYGLTLAGTVTLSDASDPSPAGLVRLRQQIAELDVSCAFSEPQFDNSLLRTAAQGHDLRLLILDPMGAALDPGPELYAQLMRALAAQFRACAEN